VKFWQALVTAQMAGGSVWADRYHDNLPVHLLAGAGNITIGIIMWLLFRATFTDK
jgi:hypothetical protein